MNIKTYLEKHDLTQQQFADLVGVSQGQIGHWIHKRQQVSATAAVLIEKNTDGEIKRSELRPDIFDGITTAA